jgi:hypothetical protein
VRLIRTDMLGNPVKVPPPTPFSRVSIGGTFSSLGGTFSLGGTQRNPGLRAGRAGTRDRTE